MIQSLTNELRNGTDQIDRVQLHWPLRLICRIKRFPIRSCSNPVNSSAARRKIYACPQTHLMITITRQETRN